MTGKAHRLSALIRNEGELKEQLVAALRARFLGYVIFRHEDRHTSGIPDLSITGSGRTSWLEVKYANPTFDYRGQQELTMLRLAATSNRAWYVIYRVAGGLRSTVILPPKAIREWEGAEGYVTTFDHRHVVDFVERIHRS